MAKKNSVGSWRKRANGVWEYAITLGRNADGKIIRKSFYSKSKKECLAKYEEFIKFDKVDISEKMRVGEWGDKWLATYKKDIVGDSTYNQYRIMVEKYIKPSLIGGMWLEDVKSIHVQAVVNGMRDKSASYTSKLKSTLWSIFDLALENDLCRKNPCNRIKTERKPARPQEERTFTWNEIERIFKACETSDVCTNAVRIAVYIMAFTGLRRGEALGLQWGDIENGMIVIRRTVILEKHHKVIKPAPKSDAGFRRVALLPELEDVLNRTRKMSPFIVHDTHNDFHNPKNFSNDYSKFIKSVSDVRPLGTHGFRHALATDLYEAGVDLRTIQAILGHDDITVTSGVYVSVSDEMIQAAMLKLRYRTKYRQELREIPRNTEKFEHNNPEC